MSLFLAALAVWVGSGLLAMALSGQTRRTSVLAAAGVLLGAVLAAVPAVQVLAGEPTMRFIRPWSVPFGEFALALDPLAAWFLLTIVLVSALAAVYGVQYLASTSSGRALGMSWFFFNVLVASMALVVMASNAVLFLVAWETMALASFFLVTYEDEKEEVRRAGWIYLVATHLGTAFLLAFFLILASETGTMDFGRWVDAGIDISPVANVLFLLALAGFGSKAGFMPAHVWLPEAHPAAPSHVSALMSGVMIKTGIYGLVRALTLFEGPPVWWGLLLAGIGLVSGILGVLFALAQRDLKRLLAYSSVENMGLIALGMGIGLLGQSYQSPPLMALGFGGALLQVLNHSLFKSLMFFGAGSVLHATGTQNMEQLGGLSKRMPWTTAAFLTGAVAICGLPPLNGFTSELLIYLGAFQAGTGPGAIALPGWLAIGGLALIGGLAAATFAKAFGIVFLGEPRSCQAAEAHECAAAMRWPMAVLAAGCLALGLGATAVLRPLARVMDELTRLPREAIAAALERAGAAFESFALAATILIGLILGLAWIRRRLLAGRQVDATVTWDCGYAKPTARMQYTASSFVQPLTALFGILLRTRQQKRAPLDLFPKAAAFSSRTPDVAHEAIYAPLFREVQRLMGKLRRLQQGTVQLYILYIAATLLALLIWKLR